MKAIHFRDHDKNQACSTMLPLIAKIDFPPNALLPQNCCG